VGLADSSAGGDEAEIQTGWLQETLPLGARGARSKHRLSM